MKEVKNQHYVPQCYLKNFKILNIKGEYLTVFDKEKGEVRYKQGISNVCSERFFYDLDAVHINNINEEEQFIEQWLANKVEPEYAYLLRCFINEYRGRHAIIKKYSRTLEYREKLSNHLALQYLRTKASREKAINIAEQIIQAYLKFHPETPKDLCLNDVHIDKKSYSLVHLQGMMGSKTISDLANAFYSHIWITVVNKTNIPFFTSDNPIVVVPHKEYSNTHKLKQEFIRKNKDILLEMNNGKGVLMDGSTYNGVASEGVEILFPISPDILLTMYHREFYPNFKYSDYSFIPITDEKIVNRYNVLQYYNSTRCVFSNVLSSDSFNLISAINKKEKSN